MRHLRRGRREPGATPTTRQVYASLASTAVDPSRRKCVAVLVTKRVIQKSLFRCSRRTGKPPIRALLQRGGMGNRCGAYDEKGIFISTRLRGNNCASFRQVHLKTPYTAFSDVVGIEDFYGRGVQGHLPYTPSRSIAKKIHQSEYEAYNEPDPPSLREIPVARGGTVQEFPVETIGIQQGKIQEEFGSWSGWRQQLKNKFSETVAINSEENSDKSVQVNVIFVCKSTFEICGHFSELFILDSLVALRNPHLKNNRIDNISILHGEIKRHASRRRDGVALNLVSSYTSKLVPVINHNDRHQRGHAGSQRMPSEHELILRPQLTNQLPKRTRFALQNKRRRLKQTMNLVIALADEVETTDSENDLSVIVIGVDEVGRASALGLVVVDALDEPARVQVIAARRGEAGVGDIVLVDGEDDSAYAGYWFEVRRFQAQREKPRQTTHSRPQNTDIAGGDGDEGGEEGEAENRVLQGYVVNYLLELDRMVIFISLGAAGW
ncbi:hypothetical protein M5K25_004174 [Dendrobium thyrsiflorum]|uniref:Uncharacterized protein n=1 Tax=Dendrobium thyrsiflorum TaxID=117978 RepID=A0ABD0VL49_DENTH